MRTLILFLCLPLFCLSQVGINTTTPEARLEIRSSNQATPSNIDGILIPKIDEYPAANPTAAQDGMLVYATGNGSVTKGFYYWNNTTTSWVSFTGATIERINDLVDGKSDNDGTNDGSSVFLGVNAGSNDDASNNANMGVGYSALQSNTSGYHNVGLGYEALASNITGIQNTAVGVNAIENNTTGNYNVGVGYNVLANNVTGFDNVAAGYEALTSNTGGFRNVAIGKLALRDNLLGDYNVAIGYQSGANSVGNGNVFLGYQAGHSETNNNRLYIENSASTNPLLYGEFDNDYLKVNGELDVRDFLTLNERSSDPADPTEGQSSIWQSDGTGSGDDGDIMIKITAGGTTKTITLVDFSTA